MRATSIAECSKGIFIKLPFVIKTFVLSNFEWPLYAGFIVLYSVVVYSLFVVAPIVCVFGAGSFFCGRVLNVLSSSAIT